MSSLQKLHLELDGNNRNFQERVDTGPGGHPFSGKKAFDLVAPLDPNRIAITMPQLMRVRPLRRALRHPAAWTIGLLLLGASGCAWNPQFREPIDAGEERLSAENTSGERFGEMTPDLQERFKAEIRSYWKSPYLWGGNAPSGIDCSGLVGQIYRRAAAIDLPRTTLDLFASGMAVENQPLQFADLVFFRLGHTRQPDHVGFYVARGYFIHASVSSGVILSLITETPYRDSYAGARRLLQ